jgi:hypothetical protein
MWKKILGGFVVVVILAGIFGQEADDQGNASSAETANAGVKNNYIGEWVQSDYFKVAVLDVSEKKGAPVEFMCDSAPDGSRYVMVNISVENTDTESRTLLTEGEIHIPYNGETLEFDQTESCTLGQDGFINFMDDIGPFVKMQGRVTFVIPERFNLSEMVYEVPRGSEKIVLKQRPSDST